VERASSVESLIGEFCRSDIIILPYSIVSKTKMLSSCYSSTTIFNVFLMSISSYINKYGKILYSQWMAKRHNNTGVIGLALSIAGTTGGHERVGSWAGN